MNKSDQNYWLQGADQPAPAFNYDELSGTFPDNISFDSSNEISKHDKMLTPLRKILDNIILSKQAPDGWTYISNPGLQPDVVLNDDATASITIFERGAEKSVMIQYSKPNVAKPELIYINWHKNDNFFYKIADIKGWKSNLGQVNKLYHLLNII